jgi:mRNA-degrading endonuclease toxin of MazEF toxin-antitoxin module
MPKDFDEWNELKKQIDSENTSLHAYPKEVWWCSFGLNIGFEQNGDGDFYKRPVLILKVFSSQTCLVAPLTTSVNIHPFRVPIGKIKEKENSVILSQIKVIDTKRLSKRICVINPFVFDQTRKVLKDLL